MRLVGVALTAPAQRLQVINADVTSAKDALASLQQLASPWAKQYAQVLASAPQDAATLESDAQQNSQFGQDMRAASGDLNFLILLARSVAKPGSGLQALLGPLGKIPALLDELAAKRAQVASLQAAQSPTTTPAPPPAAPAPPPGGYRMILPPSGAPAPGAPAAGTPASGGTAPGGPAPGATAPAPGWPAPALPPAVTAQAPSGHSTGTIAAVSASTGVLGFLGGLFVGKSMKKARK
jgi:hypothetical protein